jgi:acyl-CoA thioesterase YciA
LNSIIDSLQRSDLSAWNLSSRMALLPKDTNQHGTIFGGVILSHIDLAGAIEAKRYVTQMVVTVSMDQVVFREPVFVGDLISFYTRIRRVGRTSIETEVLVVATRDSQHRVRVVVTEAVVTYVAVDADRRPTPIIQLENRDDPPRFV